MARMLALLITLFAFQVDAQTLVRSPQGKASYCALAKDSTQFISLASTPESRIAFENPYGYFSTGLCWWHSHLQRASVYLAYYNPSAPKPTSSDVYSILKSIYYEHNVTEIPGYANFYDFTHDNEQLVTKFLSDVEILATAGGDWIHGVLGASDVSAAKLKSKMDTLYKTFQAHPALIYQMLQMPGFDAHAWLVQNITPTPSGYVLSVIDSNFPSQNYAYTYFNGQTQFAYPDDATASFVPYTYDQGQLTTFAKKAASYCR